MIPNEYIKEYRFPEYKITINTGGEEFPMKDYNLDVWIDYNNKQYYFTFFTLNNIKSLFEKNKKEGECKSGLYFNCPDMIILEEISIENIKNTIDGLIEEFAIETFYCSSINENKT